MQNDSGYERFRSYSEPHVHVSWRAILAGIVVAIATEVLLTLLGFAVGLSAFEPRADLARGIGIGLGIWMILTAVASVFAGAYFGSRVAGDPWKGDGVAHGVMVWAGFLLIGLSVISSGVGRLLSGAGSLERAVNESSASVASQARQQAQQTPAQNSQNMRRAADNIADGGAKASWVAFGVALLSLVSGALGGMLGSIGEQKQFGRYENTRRRDEERRMPPPSTASPGHPVA